MADPNKRYPEKQNTPGGATELMEVLGKEESLKRIRAGIEKLSQTAEAE